MERRRAGQSFSRGSGTATAPLRLGNSRERFLDYAVHPPAARLRILMGQAERSIQASRSATRCGRIKLLPIPALQVAKPSCPIASFMCARHPNGSKLAPAIRRFISTPSQPNSIAKPHDFVRRLAIEITGSSRLLEDDPDVVRDGVPSRPSALPAAQRGAASGFSELEARRPYPICDVWKNLESSLARTFAASIIGGGRPGTASSDPKLPLHEISNARLATTRQGPTRFFWLPAV